MNAPTKTPRTGEQLYTPTRIAKALAVDLGTYGKPSPPLSLHEVRELQTVARLHEIVSEFAKRISHGLGLPSESRHWARLLIGPIQHLRAMMGAEEAAPFFVRHSVLPAALSPHISAAQRRTFLREMRDLPFSEAGQQLGKFTDAAELMAPGNYMLRPAQ